MRPFWNAFFVLILFVNVAWSQQDQVTLSAEGIVSVMKQALNLTPSQVRQITPILKEHIRQVTALRSNTKNDASFKRRVEYLKEDLDEALENCLTDEQIAIWRKQSEKSSAFSQREPASTPAKRPARESSGKNGHLKDKMPDDGVLQSGAGAASSGGVY